MASQADKDTARAKSRQGGGQAAQDTARAKSRQNGGDGGTSDRMSQREAAAGLNLAGNNTMSGRGQPMPTMSEREEAAGLNLAGNNTLSGRDDSFYQFSPDLPSTDEPVDHGVHDLTNDVLPLGQSAFAAIICINGKPFSASIQGEIGGEIT
tara:strand:- start:788 stop:1243 length:456 start_codon:yes stop_codon:yes gene_type:complete